MAEHNDNKDQEGRSWGVNTMIQYVKDELGLNKREELKDPEKTVEKLRKRKGRA